MKIEKWSRNDQPWFVMSQDWMEKKAEVQIYIFQLTKKSDILKKRLLYMIFIFIYFIYIHIYIYMYMGPFRVPLF